MFGRSGRSEPNVLPLSATMFVTVSFIHRVFAGFVYTSRSPRLCLLRLAVYWSKVQVVDLIQVVAFGIFPEEARQILQV